MISTISRPRLPADSHGRLSHYVTILVRTLNDLTAHGYPQTVSEALRPKPKPKEKKPKIPKKPKVRHAPLFLW